MLVVKDICKNFGGIRALVGVSLDVDRGSIVGLIGPNGSGKTTLFNIISGFSPADSGMISFKGKSITGFPPYAVAKKGLGYGVAKKRLGYGVAKKRARVSLLQDRGRWQGNGIVRWRGHRL